MTLYQAEYRSKTRREKTKEAIALAMENRWEDAKALNRIIIALFPEDVEAYNRLGKACLENGDYDDARAAFTNALQLSPSNAIARKNLDRLNLLRKETQLPRKGRMLSPQVFLEESGKAGTAVLERAASKEVLARLTAGDGVNPRVVGSKLIVESTDGEYVGQIPSRLAGRLVRLISGGNHYEVAITRLSGADITVLIREVFQHPDQRGITSFPSRAARLRPYPRSPLLESDLMEEDEEIEVAFNTEWEENGDSTDLFPRQPYAKESLIEDEEEA
jgi:tetratricopeptide (TPR) repeat protein